MTELLKVGDIVRWDRPNAGIYPPKYGGDRIMVVTEASSEFVYLKFFDTEEYVGSSEGVGFYHHRFIKVPHFLALAEKAITESKETNARNSSEKG